MNTQPDKYHGIGGSFVRNPATGERELVQESTKDHPDGNKARYQDGTPVEKPAGRQNAPAAAQDQIAEGDEQ